MAAKTTLFAQNLLSLLFQAIPFANVADNAVSAPLTSLYFSLHVTTPDVTGNQNSNEVTYTGYQRQAVARTAVGFTVAGNQAYPVANLVFPKSTGGTPTVNFTGIGTAPSGSGTLWYFGSVAPPITISTTVVQTLAGGAAGTVVAEL